MRLLATTLHRSQKLFKPTVCASVHKAKVEPETVQASYVTRKYTTLDLYTQEDSDEARAAQGAFLAAVGLKPKVVL